MEAILEFLPDLVLISGKGNKNKSQCLHLAYVTFRNLEDKAM